MSRIALIHVPLFSHLEAATRLTGALVAQGHEVIAWAPGWASELVVASGAGFEPLDLEMPSAPSFVGHAAAIAELAVSHAGELIDQLFAADVDLVVHDSLALWGRVVAEHLGLPRVVSHPMYPIIAPFRISTDEERAVPRGDPELDRAAFERHWLSIAQRWGVEIGSAAAVVHSTPGSDATVMYTTQTILGDFRAMPGWHCVGPLMTPAPASARAPGRPLVYACFGTSFNRRKKLFDAVVEALADEPYDVLISTGKRDSSDDAVISASAFESLPQNIVIRDFVDGREMLARASVHVTHGGCNSVHESLLAGTPMLFIPQAYDQAPLAQRITHLGAGRFARENPGSIRRNLRRLLEDEVAMARAGELAAHLADYDGGQRVARVFDRVLSR